VVEAGFHFGALWIGRAGHSQEDLGLEVRRVRFRNRAAACESQGTFNLFSHQNYEFPIRLAAQLKQR
jgi:hypothetical protein